MLLSGSCVQKAPTGLRPTATWATQRALPPTAMSLVQAAFERAGNWHLKSATIAVDHLSGIACVADGECFPFLLADPVDGCAGSVAGPWCVVWTGAAPPPNTTGPLLQALQATPDHVWLDPRGTDGLPSQAPKAIVAAPPGWGRLKAWSLAAALVLLPLALGAALGATFRRVTSRRSWIRVLTPIALVCGPAAGIRLVPIGFWDLVWIGAICCAGFAAGLRATRLRYLTITTALLLTGSACLEAVIRLALPEPGRYPSSSAAHFVYRPADEEAACYAIDHGREPPWIDWRRGGLTRPGVRVLQLGDSMVFGTRVEGDETFAVELEHLDPGFAQVNFGIPASSTDVQYAALQSWIDEIRPARVILHFYVGNDIKEMDDAYPCCDMGPLLDYASGHATTRCPNPRWRFSTAAILAHAPPPYVLRVATDVSHAARYSLQAFDGASAWLGGSMSGSAPAQRPAAWEHLELILAALRDDVARHHASLVISVLPDRGLLESAHPEAEDHWEIRNRALALTRRLDIPVIDPWDFLRGIVTREGSAAMFVTPPAYEIHFSPEGHRRYARWLREQLGPGLMGAPPVSSSGTTTVQGPPPR